MIGFCPVVRRLHSVLFSVCKPSRVVLRAPPLRPGAPVAVIAPASPPRDLERYRQGLARLRSLFDVRSAWAPGQEHGYLSGPDRVRAADLGEAIQDPDIQAIFCVRGGYGTLRLLHRIDWSAAREHPTLLIGYSDITILHLAFFAQADWTGVSGPVVTEWAKIGDEMLESFLTLVQGGTPNLGAETLSPLSPGSATGPLLGGNLSVLTRLIGTPYAPDWTGSILVFEDVAEAPYRIDRMLAHLQHAGVLEAIGGVVLGHFKPENGDSNQPTLSLETIFREYFADRPYPVVTNFRYGHILPRACVPIGVPVQLEAHTGTARLTVKKSVVQR